MARDRLLWGSIRPVRVRILERGRRRVGREASHRRGRINASADSDGSGERTEAVEEGNRRARLGYGDGRRMKEAGVRVLGRERDKKLVAMAENQKHSALPKPYTWTREPLDKEMARGFRKQTFLNCPWSSNVMALYVFSWY
ncbi:hypothetical protein TorRG33x02_052090 [Trema orientale]|uniref:Uncharacterized protein n=1 Tax=Trema orientale TaxID=63057 RepID=A0A2P5FME5_TREOI|nr:hypothetical protein TorRG33x02_052090 [Trema orientale]